MSHNGAESSEAQSRTVKAVGGSVSVRGVGASSRRFLGAGVSMGKDGFPSRGSMVVGRPRTNAICMSHSDKINHIRRRSCSSHRLSRTSPGFSSGFLRRLSLTSLWRPISCASLIVCESECQLSGTMPQFFKYAVLRNPDCTVTNVVCRFPRRFRMETPDSL